jgi:hypothetical protein
MDSPTNGRAKAFDIEKLGPALQKAGLEARRRHALEGRSVPIIEDGKIVWLTPEMIFAAEAAENEKGQQDAPR